MLVRNILENNVPIGEDKEGKRKGLRHDDSSTNIGRTFE